MKFIPALFGAAVLLASPAHALDWYVACDKAETDAFGDTATGQNCTLSVDNLLSKEDLIGLAYVIRNSPILIIDTKGARPYPVLSDPLCRRKPTRMAVDKKRIDSLSHEEQVQAILNGKVFVREEQARWPKCNFVSRATYLTGISAAYKRMLAEWGQ